MAVQMTEAQFNQLLGQLRGGRNGKRLTVFNSTTGEEWLAWKETFLKTRELNDWDNVVSRNQLAAAIEGPARRMVSDIPTNAGNYGDLLARYESRFLPAAASRLAVTSFQSASQTEEETEIEWHTRLRELFVRAYPNDGIEDSRLLIDHYIRHLKSPSILDHCYMQNPGTYAAALTCATNKAGALQVVKQAASGGTVKPNSTLTLSSMSVAKKEGLACWVCGSPDHFQRNCPVAAFQGGARQGRGGGGRGGRGGAGRGGGQGNGRNKGSNNNNNPGGSSGRGKKGGRRGGRGRGSPQANTTPSNPQGKGRVQALEEATQQVQQVSLQDDAEDGEESQNF